VTRTRLVRNAARCLTCGDVVESRDEDDVGVCSCGALCVAGGLLDPHISFEARAGGGWEDASVVLEVLPGGGQGELDLPPVEAPEADA